MTARVGVHGCEPFPDPGSPGRLRSRRWRVAFENARIGGPGPTVRCEMQKEVVASNGQKLSYEIKLGRVAGNRDESNRSAPPGAPHTLGVSTHGHGQRQSREKRSKVPPGSIHEPGGSDVGMTR